jgi:acyl dehydratase
MGVSDAPKGKSYDAVPYEVGLEKIREYAYAVGETDSVHLERSAAQEAGFRDVVAPPMFCVVYKWRAMAVAGTDPEIGMNLAALVHGGQEFVWGEPVCAGDVISTQVTFKEAWEEGGKGFYVFESASANQDGAEVCRGTWTNIVRGV